MRPLSGVVSVLPTPFDRQGEVDEASLDRIVDCYIDAGVDGLTALGVTSEVTHLSETERSRILERVMERVDGRVPVVVGTTTPATRTCVESSRAARAAGAAAVMVSPPRMPKLNSDAVVKHFATVAEAVDLPIVLQDFPPVQGYAMETHLVARLVREIPNIETVKLEDPPTPLKTARILEVVGDEPVTILGGLGGGFLLEELLHGAHGAMTGFAYPELLVEVVRRFQEGDRGGAADYFYRSVSLMRFEFQAGIGVAIRKELLRRRGVVETVTVRAPGAPLDAHTSGAMDSLLNWISTQEGFEWISA